jgi:putative tryptophan/tyrosine transport system permease protein
LSGALAGSMTGFIHTRLKIAALLAGILVMTALYSINLTILGRSNVPLLNLPNIFSTLNFFKTPVLSNLFTGSIFAVSILALVTYLLLSDFGIAMHATGNSPSMAQATGINYKAMKIMGLSLANSLTALSGYLIAQYQNFTDINMGIGVVITGLGSVLIGDVIIGFLAIRSTLLQLISVLTGSILFQLVLAFSLTIGIDPNLLKLVTALFVLLIVSIPFLIKGRQGKPLKIKLNE